IWCPGPARLLPHEISLSRPGRFIKGESRSGGMSQPSRWPARPGGTDHLREAQATMKLGSGTVIPIRDRGRVLGIFVGVAMTMGLRRARGAAADPPRPRARDLGIEPGVFSPGPLNAITDVDGVRVGQVTLVEGATIRTGVTAILPHGGNLFQEKVAGAVF